MGWVGGRFGVVYSKWLGTACGLKKHGPWMRFRGGKNMNH